MRKPLAVGTLLVLCAACAKKPQTEVVVEPTPAVEPAAPQPAAAQPEKKPKPPRKQYDPNNFAGKTLAQWREQLKDKDPAKCQTAIMAIRALGPAAADATPDLVRVPAGMSDLAEALEAIGPAAAPHMVAALKTPNPATDYRIAMAFKKLGNDAAGAVPGLLELASSPDAKVKAAALDALVGLGPVAKSAANVFRDALKSPNQRLQLQAAVALADADPEGSADAAVPILLAARSQQSYDVRVIADQALAALPKFGPAAVAARLKLPDGSPNMDVLLGLSSFEPEQLAVLAPQLAALLSSEKPDKNWPVLYAIRRAKLGGKVAVPEVLKLAATGPAKGRADAIETAFDIGVPATELVPLVRILFSENPQLALRVLNAIGPAAKDLAPLAIAQLASPDPQVKGAAVWALFAIDPSSADGARGLLDAVDPDNPNRSTINLNDARFFQKEIAAAFRPHLTHPKPKLRLLAAKLVFPNDPTDAVAAKLLKENAHRDEPSLIPNSPPYSIVDADVFKSLREAGKAGTPHLAELLKHVKPNARAEAAYSLAVIGPAAASVAGDLAAVVADESPAVRFAALSALGRIGEPAKAHLGVVRAALKDADEGVRFAAAKASLAIAPTETAEPAAVLIVLSPPPARQNPTTLRLIPKDPEAARQSPQKVPSGEFENAIRDLLFDSDPEAGCRANAFSPRRAFSFK